MEGLYRAPGCDELLTREEADRLSAKHELTIQIGGDLRDVKIGAMLRTGTAPPDA